MHVLLAVLSIWDLEGLLLRVLNIWDTSSDREFVINSVGCLEYVISELQGLLLTVLIVWDMLPENYSVCLFTVRAGQVTLCSA